MTAVVLFLLCCPRHEEDEDLTVQLDVFEEQRLDDEDELITPDGVDLTSHLDVFHALFQRVRSTFDNIDGS